MPQETAVADLGVRIGLLGGFEVSVAGRPVTAESWRLRKAKTLVKLLALAVGHRIHRDTVVGILWPDLEPTSATNNLHQALYVARRVFAEAPTPMFRLRDDVIMLTDGPPPWLDTEAFRRRRPASPGDLRTRRLSGGDRAVPR